MINEGEKPWIFLSHSFKDWDKVRKLRNILEEKGRKPLMFFLKCLNDNSEVDELVKREIMSREFFILCDSENARNSKWVQEEKDFVEKLEKEYEIIDLEKELADQIYKLDRIIKKSTIFFSYHNNDEEIAKRIIDKLAQSDFHVCIFNPDIKKENYVDQVNNNIEASIDKGFFLFLLSEAYMNSIWAKAEVNHALNILNSGIGFSNNIICISILNKNKLMDLSKRYQNIKKVDFSDNSLEQNINKLIIEIKSRKAFV